MPPVLIVSLIASVAKRFFLKAACGDPVSFFLLFLKKS
jgi:hypothetical protein